MKKRNKLRFYRRLLDFTQTDLSESVDITQKVLSDYERGRCKVPDDLKPKIAKALGIPEGMIFSEVRGRDEKTRNKTN
ncbi:hypothetical protein ES703_117915 [subsurface metagenome]